MEELFKGNVLEVVECMKDEIINQIMMINFKESDFDFNNVELIQTNANLYLECINGIYQDYITEILNKDDKIKVWYHPMCSVNYTKLGDEE